MMDVDEIVKLTKEYVTQFGNHPATLFVVGTNSKGGVSFSDFGQDHDQRVRAMAQAGLQVAREKDVGELEQLIFICEAWASPPRKEFVRPSRDPNHIEVLLVNTLDVPTDKQELHMFEIERDTKGNVSDLKQVTSPKEGVVASPLLPAFVAGFTSFKR
jgi:hypothetical protein